MKNSLGVSFTFFVVIMRDSFAAVDNWCNFGDETTTKPCYLKGRQVGLGLPNLPTLQKQQG